MSTARGTWIEVVLRLKLQGNKLYVRSVREKDEQLSALFKQRSDMLISLASMIYRELPKKEGV